MTSHWFWLFMLGVNLLTPLIMIVFGGYFEKKAPKNIQSIFGYRTTLSMKNQDTWQFAHHHCGRVWKKLGWITLAVSLAVLLCVWNQDLGTIGTVGAAVCLLQVVLLFCSIIPTERALRKTFDSNGNRR